MRATSANSVRVGWVLAALLGALLWASPERAAESKNECLMVPASKVQAVFGPFDDVFVSGGYLPGGENPVVGKVAEASISTCAFRRTSTMEALQIIGNWYPSEEEAASGFRTASKAQSHGGPYYTATARKGPIQVYEGKGRSLAYLDHRVVIAHWMVQNGKSLEPKDVPGDRLTPLLVSVLCPKFPDCKVNDTQP